MANYVEVEQALEMNGLRVVLSPGVPGPWSEAAKGILYVKKLPYTKIRQEIGGENLPLRRWSAQTTAPVFVYENERPRSLWIDQLYLAERLAPDPALIPETLEQRALMFGLANELCGEDGFGWSRRLMMLHTTLTNPNTPEAARKGAGFLGRKYGYSPAPAEAAPKRVAEILRAMDAQLRVLLNQPGAPLFDLIDREQLALAYDRDPWLPGFMSIQPSSTAPVAFLLDVNRWLERSGVTVRA